MIAESNRRKALANSKVKIRGGDVVASFKFLYGIPVSLIIGTLANIVYLFFFSHHFFDSYLARLVSVPFFCLIFSSYLICKPVLPNP